MPAKKTTTSEAVAPEATASDEGKVFQVKLKTVVSLYGTYLKPGTEILVDAETLAKLGDAVDHVVEV